MSFVVLWYKCVKQLQQLLMFKETLSELTTALSQGWINSRDSLFFECSVWRCGYLPGPRGKQLIQRPDLLGPSWGWQCQAWSSWTQTWIQLKSTKVAWGTTLVQWNMSTLEVSDWLSQDDKYNKWYRRRDLAERCSTVCFGRRGVFKWSLEARRIEE